MSMPHRLEEKVAIRATEVETGPAADPLHHPQVARLVDHVDHGDRAPRDQRMGSTPLPLPLRGSPREIPDPLHGHFPPDLGGCEVMTEAIVGRDLDEGSLERLDQRGGSADRQRRMQHDVGAAGTVRRVRQETNLPRLGPPHLGVRAEALHGDLGDPCSPELLRRPEDRVATAPETGDPAPELVSPGPALVRELDDRRNVATDLIARELRCGRVVRRHFRGSRSELRHVERRTDRRQFEPLGDGQAEPGCRRFSRLPGERMRDEREEQNRQHREASPWSVGGVPRHGTGVFRVSGIATKSVRCGSVSRRPATACGSGKRTDFQDRVQRRTWQGEAAELPRSRDV